MLRLQSHRHPPLGALLRALWNVDAALVAVTLATLTVVLNVALMPRHGPLTGRAHFDREPGEENGDQEQDGRQELLSHGRLAVDYAVQVQASPQWGTMNLAYVSPMSGSRSSPMMMNVQGGWVRMASTMMSWVSPKTSFEFHLVSDTLRPHGLDHHLKLGGGLIKL